MPARMSLLPLTVVLILSSAALARHSVLEDLMDRSDIVARVRVLAIEESETDEVGVVEWQARCRNLRCFKWHAKGRAQDAIRFRFRQLTFLKDEHGKPLAERMPVQKGKEYVVFLKGAMGEVMFPSDEKLCVAYGLADRWVGIQPYSGYLVWLLGKRDREAKRRREHYEKLKAIWRKTEPPEGEKEEALTRKEMQLLLAEVDHPANRDSCSLAVKALGNLRTTEAVPPLIAILADGKRDGGTCSQAAIALGDIGDMRALGPLLDALADDRPTLAWGAGKAIHALAPGAQVAKPYATHDLVRRLVDALERRGIPDIRWASNSSAPGMAAAGTLMSIDAVCVGLNLFEVDTYAREERLRAASRARALLESGWLDLAHTRNRLTALSEFCGRFQPELFEQVEAGATEP